MDDMLALLVDYEYCTGCCVCETACLREHGYGVESMGIKVIKLGPWKLDNGAWQYDFVPIPTDFCDMCKKYIDNCGLAACVHHCDYNVIHCGDLEAMTALMHEKKKMMLFTPKV